LSVSVCSSARAAEILFNDILLHSSYHNKIRPVANASDMLTVYLGLSISQLIEIDETEQVMVSSVWLKQRWNDYRLRWDPARYDNIKSLNIPIPILWRPDITLYNTADGEYDVLVPNKALVTYDGTVKWSPPAVYKSVCKIWSKDFPFDEQKCVMKFGSWTYNHDFLDLRPMDNQVDQADYWANGEWYIVETPVERNVIRYACCTDQYVDITFAFILHRNPLFYVVTLVVPCLLIAFSTLLVFYLPTDAQERITLSISILIAVIVFLLLIPSLLPPTSDQVPLVGRFILFTLCMSIASLLGTILVIHVHYRTADTHVMPRWMRVVFIIYMPRILRVERPTSKEDYENYTKERRQEKLKQGYMNNSQIWTNYSNGRIYHSRKSLGKQAARFIVEAVSPSLLEEIEWREGGCGDDHPETLQQAQSQIPLPSHYIRAIDCIHYIVSHLKKADEEEQISDDWKFVALVMDRMLLWLFFIVLIIMTTATFMAPVTFWESENTHRIPRIEKPITISSAGFSDYIA
ncbi:neuronal acetylcholine receptor subunit alpha-3-like, partial [Saccoglossus kowalevskii]